jgi:hypothetical protein
MHKPSIINVKPKIKKQKIEKPFSHILAIIGISQLVPFLRAGHI